MEKIFVLKDSICKRCICLLLCVLQLPFRNSWVRKFRSLLTLLWMSYCAGSFAMHWFLLGWNQTIVQGCSCQSHNPCGFSAGSEKQTVEQSEPVQPRQTPPAAYPTRTWPQFLEDSLAHSLFYCTEHLLQEREPEQCQVGFSCAHLYMSACTSTLLR